MKIGYFGTPEHSAKLLDALHKNGFEIAYVVTNVDKLTGRKKQLTFPPVKKLALELGLEVLQFTSIKSEEAIQKINSFPVDLNIVFAYGSIIPKAIFDFPPMGTINLHGSLLPEFRGASPVQSAILAGKDVTGITIQYVTEKLDSGNIITKVPIEITLEDDSSSLMEKVTDIGVEEMLKLLQNSNNSRFPSVPQEHSLATNCHKIHANDRKLEFTGDSKTVYNKIRAFYPWNICYCTYRGKRINIHKAKIYTNGTENINSLKIPGSLHLLDKRTMGVECGDNNIILLEAIQPENKNVMRAVDFINGFKPKQGELLT
ncbi:MAG: methionyl-tRNA formyltransferase [Leptospiraceae bacterium]|nr:methionyl-tRNA formyltransferase [Leptospiraceae bacterium]MCP5495430.1 methionyl-tRNA formyltransferase [Leptospiraceae bacterium]